MTAKRYIYAIFSHGDSAQPLRLVRTLRALSPDSHIVVHHDPSHTEIAPDAVEAAGGRAIPNPVRGRWGDFSLVEQHLHTQQWCLQNLDFDWYVNLTGQSYPIRPLAELEALLETTSYDAYLTWFDAYDPAVWPIGEAVRRYHFQYVELPRFPYWHKLPPTVAGATTWLIRWINRVQPLVRFFPLPRSQPTRFGTMATKRPFSPSSRKLIGSNLNMNLSRRVVERIVEIARQDEAYAHYFSRTIIADEVFFSTIVCNEPDFVVANDNLRHIYWPSECPASGGVMDLRHLPALEASPAYFALKFDQNVCPEILDHLDIRLGLRPKGNAQ